MEGMCCVDGCDHKQNSDESVLFHKFPKNAALKRSWLESIPMKKDIPRTLLICSDHFIESDYKHVRGKRILNLDNIPSVFTKICKDPDKNENDKVIKSDDETPLTTKTRNRVDNTLKITELAKDYHKSDDDSVIETDDEAPLKRKPKKHVHNKHKITELAKDYHKNDDDNRVMDTNDEAPLKRKTRKHVDNKPKITELAKDNHINDDDKVTETDDEAPLKRKTRKLVDNKPKITELAKDNHINDDDKVTETDDEAPLKRKTRKLVDNKPKITELAKDNHINDDDKVTETDDEASLKRKTRKLVDNKPKITELAKDNHINDDDKVTETDDELSLKRKTRKHVDNTLTKLAKNNHKHNDDKAIDEEASSKGKTRKRVTNVKKSNKRNVRSDSVKVRKASDIHNDNKIDNESKIITKEEAPGVNIEVRKADCHDFDQKLDLEDNIPSFIIKDNKPRETIEITVPPCDVEPPAEITEVVNIEVSIDPTLLMMDEPSVIEEIVLSDDSDIEVTAIENKSLPADPVSLLTSSDEDEVVYLAPKYDLVEVSDETDEEDRPLITFTNKLKQKSNSYVCSKCEFKTDTHAKYVKHLRKHTIFMCTMCGQALKGKDQLNYHMRKHGMEKKYKCHLCSYKAKYQMSLILHISTHKTYLRCKACPFMTWDRNILLRHRESHLLNR